MFSYGKLMCGVVLVACCISAAYTIKCYECESNAFSRFRDPFDAAGNFEVDCDRHEAPKYLQDLSPNLRLVATGCLKKKFNFNENSIVIHRSCYWGEPNTTTGCQDDPTKSYLKQLSCDVCYEDKCNSSTGSGPIAAVIALFLILIRTMA